MQNQTKEGTEFEDNPSMSLLCSFTEPLGSDCNGGDQRTVQIPEMESVKLEDCSSTLELNIKVEEEEEEEEEEVIVIEEEEEEEDVIVIEDEEEERCAEFCQTEVPFEIPDSDEEITEDSEEEESQRSVYSRKEPNPGSSSGKISSASGATKISHQIPKGQKPHLCSQCGKSYRHSASLSRHRRIHDVTKPFHCSKCGKSFSDSRGLFLHQRIHNVHKSTSEKPSHKRVHKSARKKPSACSQCGNNHSECLCKQQKAHTVINPYNCCYCGITFSQFGRLLLHQQRMHAGGKRQPSPLYAESFSRSRIRQAYRRTDVADGLYHCSQCEKSFVQFGCLVSHQRKHSGEKPFRCSLCGESFSHSQGLIRHQRMHTVHLDNDAS